MQGAHAATRRVLELLKAWVSDERLDSTRLLVVTTRAVATQDGEDVLDLAHAPVCPAVSLAWGFWGERSGLTRGLGDLIIAWMARHGVLPMTSEHALSMLDEALGPSEALRVPMRVDAVALAAQRDGLPAILRELIRARGGRAVAPELPLSQRLSTLSAEQAEQVLLELIRSTAASIFGTSYDDVEPERPMVDLELDSVMAVELRNRLGTATGLRLGATVILDHPTPLVLAQRLARELSGLPQS